MKKIILFCMLFFCTCITIVNADGFTMDVQDKNSTKQIIYYEDGKQITFEKAKEKFDIDEYFTVVIDGIEYFFYKGNQISEKEYNDGIALKQANDLLKQYGEYGIRVRNTKNIISAIDDLYKNRKYGTYYLVYSSTEYNNINFDEIDNYVRTKYMFDTNKNVFSYSEHAIYSYPRTIYSHDEESYVIDISSLISKKEEEKVNEFLDVFVKEYKDKGTHEKIEASFYYLIGTVERDNNCMDKDANLSAYKLLIDRKGCKVGLANTFQLLMEKLNVESYIYEDYTVSENSYKINKIFNVVKLNDKYYIVDFLEKNEGLLIGDEVGYNLSNGIKISNEKFERPKIAYTFDYDKYNKLVESIRNDVKKHESLNEKREDLKEVDLVSYLVLILILIGILGVILFFTKRGR